MEIKYMKLLNDNLSVTAPNTGIKEAVSPISVEEIIALENKYNGGRLFPAALRELLFLAGGDCYVLDYGINDTQEQMQESSRRFMTIGGRNRVISRPFYVIDVYNAGDQFLFVYLDEGKDDPDVYEALIGYRLNDWIHLVKSPLSALIDGRIKRFLSGGNPF
ncbi:SMI1/KNR4 family protein [Mucilaginibacter rubeus]|uniref:SMI1/KNR4 family protein n=1 Tax=Mucilaginibacter rubeus TaxID=2027860 RepID=A0AAE6JIR2_9SPHI|nr:MULTISPECIES: SMI1/KNR4 family protein [Mucilaginibacter]QEM06370.1 SMI1/KNR4 family protein [Mucilaginibacter rubeus]QEM18953.1 SMI1/KNR4 family protein [Mucilaginibacter gossypii]QTE44506.1 SMI1/KNR4 family protein [Mucilaginibacter rubeus]QTE51104.1 SMI1/KNR4 family protein [Mucilaginibacter rubeus]QTE56190.1 SMI1/KNR4 family protein [Mucilaginibacter rubeus]